MPDPNPETLISPFFWIIVTFWSAIVGFICYPMSSSFRAVFGDLDFFKFSLYYQLPFILILIIGIVHKFGHTKRFCYTTNLGFLVLTITSVYTVFEDKGSSKTQEEHQLGTIMNLVSSGAFTLMSMSMSRLMQLPYEVGLSSFFLGCLMVQLIKINNVVAVVGGAVCWCLLVFLRHFSTPRLHSSIIGYVNHFCNAYRDYIGRLQALVYYSYFIFDVLLSNYIRKNGPVWPPQI